MPRRTLEYTITTLPPVWPGIQTPAHQRIKAPFKTPSWTLLLAELARETDMLGARRIEIAVDVSPTQLRQDGNLRADARPAPPVILSFDDAEGVRHAYPADRFGWWQDNLSAIARSLEDLRRVERYGIQSRLIRAGFRALPGVSAHAEMNPESAAAALAEITGFSPVAIRTNPSVAKDAARRSMNLAHPDRNDGKRDQWNTVERARAVLSSHHGIAL